MNIIENREVLRNVLGVIGDITSFLLFLSPLSTMYTIWSNKSVGEYKYHPIVAGLINCMMWIFYSMSFVHPHSFLVTLINGAGLAVYIGYNVVYFICTDNNTRKYMVCYYVAELLVMVVLICVTLLAFHGHTERSKIVGIFCDIFGIILYCSPLTVMRNVMKTRSVEYMPLSLSVATFFNGIVWSAYALIPIDYYILIANAGGTLLGCAQLILYACYCHTTGKKEDVPEQSML